MCCKEIKLWIISFLQFSLVILKKKTWILKFFSFSPLELPKHNCFWNIWESFWKLHCKTWCFPLRISAVNMSKSIFSKEILNEIFNFFFWTVTLVESVFNKFAGFYPTTRLKWDTSVLQTMYVKFSNICQEILLRSE